ncbi:MAG: hypothetical protein A2802_00025 [Candidatus Woykebacteria bacterium RIFCSPHIGHO2_01_FULL_43_29]|uniref:Uncharacterized protein n=2 Tax=Candidatus Woykeibacteriota TaxID=1817899 RepID=A0A1G1WWN5_9BACT|nr:MAG: hypothetical protein A2802_00025 [Candidatus Woykebacteria bacterium RIFCSPHIGHO2_01_FULL_43_29]OGY30265.1 MAG: hypothetical protein A3J50_04350 [Candidatus Woykebacteria bacterium RIFCSPHIGHO2_02_FULL_43_16b]OGY32104.1 MAG: hypothetical protein A3A61_00290 [Candidatus Woykebacteria bacterium RIFCSPLOWO2_01_FULL_43_14]
MAKRRTKEQKILTTLRKLQDRSSQPAFQHPSSPQIKLVTYPGTQLAQSSPYSLNSTDYGYVKKDLAKILLLGALAIGFQVVLSFLISNTGLAYNIPLLGRR